MLGILLHAQSSEGRQQENRRIPTTVLEEASATWDPHVSEIPWRTQVERWAGAWGLGNGPNSTPGPSIGDKPFSFVYLFSFLSIFNSSHILYFYFELNVNRVQT
jgi:hypothetical protein